MGDVQAIHEILSQYELASAQQVNRMKTNLFFGKSVSEDTKNSLKGFLSVPEIKEYEKYLSLPTVVGRNKKESLTFIKERIWGKLQRVEGKAPISSGKRSFIERNCTSHSNFCYELF